MKLSLRSAIVLVVALTLVAAAQAKKSPSSSTLNVCTLVGAKEAASVGEAASCHESSPEPGVGAIDYVANWDGATTRSPGLQVTIARYSSPDLLKLAIANLKQGLPGTPVSRVKGLPGPGEEAVGSAAAGVHFAVGDYVVYMTLTSLSTPPTSAAPLVPVARALVTKLKNL